MRIFTTRISPVLWVNISLEIKISFIYEKCQLSISKFVMHITDKPITKPHSFFIIPGLIIGTTVILYIQVCNSLVAVHALPTETPLCCANRQKYFQEFSDRWPCQAFPQLKHNFFLTASCQLKYRGFKFSSLIWKCYLQMDMLCSEIYHKIFSWMICMSFFI
jgi:hypothetical protein